MFKAYMHYGYSGEKFIDILLVFRNMFNRSNRSHSEINHFVADYFNKEICTFFKSKWLRLLM